VKILVSVKRVSDPDNANKVRPSADARAVDTGALKWTCNPFDDYALEAAMRLNENAATKETFGEIIAVAMGSEDAIKDVLNRPLAVSANRRIWVNAADNQLDASVVASALKALVEKEKPDLVLMGKQAVDGDSNAAGQMLAEMLQWPSATFARSIEVIENGKALKVGREVDTGILTLEVQLPAVVTVDLGIIASDAVKNGLTPATHRYEGRARLLPLKVIMTGSKKPAERMELSELGVKAEPLTSYQRYSQPPRRSGSTVFVQSAAELVQKLHQEAKVV